MNRASRWLLPTALFGLVVPNGFFLYWLLYEYQGLGPVLHDHLALAFILDAFGALILLCVYFARRPIGAVRWPWFLLLSLAGGLWFGLPLYFWLNRRPPPHDPGRLGRPLRGGAVIRGGRG